MVKNVYGANVFVSSVVIQPEQPDPAILKDIMREKQYSLFPELEPPQGFCRVCGRKIKSGDIGSTCARNDPAVKRQRLESKLRRCGVRDTNKQALLRLKTIIEEVLKNA